MVRSVLTFDPGMRAAALAIVLVSATASAAPKLAPHYAPMFEKGHTWTYKLARTDFDYVQRRDGTMKAVPMKPAISTFTCTVTNVVVLADAVISTIHCDTEIDSNYSFRPDGMWVATKAGVTRAGGDTDDLPQSTKDLDLGAPMIRAKPQVFRNTTNDGYGGVLVAAVTSANGTWCASTDTTKGGAGDGAITTTCFKAGVGLVRGALDYHGGTPRIVEYTAQQR